VERVLFDQDSELDLVLAVIGTMVFLVWALSPVVQGVAPPWGMVLAVAAGWPTLANLLRYKRAPIGCAVVPAGLLLFLGARLAGLAPEIQAVALMLPNLPFYLWVSAIKPLAERREAVNALGEIGASQDPTLWAGYLEHPALSVRFAAAEALSGRPLAEVEGFLGAPLESEDPGVRGAAAQAIRALAQKEREPVAEWLQAQAAASGGPEGSESGLPAAGLLAELDPARAEALLEGASTGLRLAIAEGLLYRAKESGGEEFGRAAQLLIEVVSTSQVDGQRGDAYYLAARFSVESEALSAALLGALRERSERPTVEELALLGELGQEGRDAVRAAAFAGEEDYDFAAAATEAVEGITGRAGSLGSAEAEVESVLTSARDAIRERHPQGENRLADQLVGRLEVLLISKSGS
jgi:hypothetical protein